MEMTSDDTEQMDTASGTPPRSGDRAQAGELLYPGLRTLSGPPGGSGSAGPIRVLVADDDEEFVSLIEQLGSRLGCGVAVARNFEAFQSANVANEPEVIFLGLTVGGNDAVELLRYLAERRSRAYIVLAGSAELKVLESAERLGRSRRLSMHPYRCRGCAHFCAA
jgi:CheY-like chemotaxis protein